ncbi:permease-like cell division protein FtsX [Candidatus Williamhamiltonella defendens]|uniref:Cell division protein FtsX n=1 Tax=Candidatus Williamhamiltonella defendens TaxID=138072 RepID=A0A2D3TFE1_9ENTR|nr:permease-like cell division protein FtsX [Candidatus Hamiltonella defensa]ATW34532.1 cell division protein FtsX [Candidatus Hamiltonella defensa]
MMKKKKIIFKTFKGAWLEQWRYSWRQTLLGLRRQPLSTFLTIMVIAFSLTLPSLCYIFWKNVHHAAILWYPKPQLTAFLDKTLDESASKNLVAILKQEHGVDKVQYLSREETLAEFREASGFSDALKMLEENPLPAVAIITPQAQFQTTDALNKLKIKINKVVGVTEVRMDDSWFIRLVALTELIKKTALVIGLLMLTSVFLVIGHSIRSSLFSQREAMNVMKLIGATKSFILQPFLNVGVLLGFTGALLSFILSQALIWKLDVWVTQSARSFDTIFVFRGLNWNEGLLLLLSAAMMGWVSAWLATVQHLRKFTVS